MGLPKPDDVSLVDVQLGVVSTLLEPAMRLACAMRLTLADVELLARTTYVRVARERGLSVRETARRIGCGKSTVTEILADARERRLAEQPGARHDRRRKLIALAGEGAFSIDAACDVFPGLDRDAVREATEELVADGLLTGEGDGPFALATGVYSYVRSADTDARIAGLRQVLEVVTESVYQRFFGTPEGSFVRVMQFDAARAEEVRTLGLDQWQRLEPRARELDAEARSVGGRVTATALLILAEHARDRRWVLRPSKGRSGS